jgi:AcrR family transcriptional regulator
MGTGEAGPAKRPRGEVREEAILEAALELVAEIGFERATIDAIAGRAGASKATIYRRWSGKSDLVAEAIRRGRPERPALPDTGSLRGDLIALVEAIHRVMTSKTGLVTFGVLVAMRSDPVLADLVRAQMGPRPISDDNAVSRAIARGEVLPGTDPRLVPRVAAPMINANLMLTGGRLDQSFLVGLVDDILIPLLTAEPARAPGPAGLTVSRPGPGVVSPGTAEPGGQPHPKGSPAL